MLHAVRQFSRARGLHIDIGAVSIGTSGVDPRALMLYLRDLDVKFFVDQISKLKRVRYSRGYFKKQRNSFYHHPKVQLKVFDQNCIQLRVKIITTF